MPDNQHEPKDYADFNPWPYLNRLIGFVFVILGIYWLARFEGGIFMGSKIVLVSAGALWGKGLRHPLSHKVQPSFFLGIALIPAGLALGIFAIEPQVFTLIAHYVMGGLALILGGRRLTMIPVSRREY